MSVQDSMQTVFQKEAALGRVKVEEGQLLCGGRWGQRLGRRCSWEQEGHTCNLLVSPGLMGAACCSQ